MKKTIALLLLVSLCEAVAAQEDRQKIEKQQIIIQQDGANSEQLSISIDGDDVLINGKPMQDQDDKKVKVIRKKMIFKDGEVIYDSDNENYDRYSQERPGNIRKRPFLGVMSEKDDKGARIKEVTDESAAAVAGLIKDDIITGINDISISGPESLSEAIGQFNPGDKVTIKYLRNNKKKTLSLNLGEREERRERRYLPGNKEGMPKTLIIPFEGGGELPDLPMMEGLGDIKITTTPSSRQKLGIKIQDTEDESGVKILEVDKESAGFKSGLQKDDIITEINGKKVKNTDEARLELKESAEKSLYKLRLNRGGKEIQMEVKIPKKLKTIDL